MPLDAALVTFLDGELVDAPDRLWVAYLADELRKSGKRADVYATSALPGVEEGALMGGAH
jgi:hypothetical protein